MLSQSTYVSTKWSNYYIFICTLSWRPNEWIIDTHQHQWKLSFLFPLVFLLLLFSFKFIVTLLRISVKIKSLSSLLSIFPYRNNFIDFPFHCQMSVTRKWRSCILQYSYTSAHTRSEITSYCLDVGSVYRSRQICLQKSHSITLVLGVFTISLRFSRQFNWLSVRESNWFCCCCYSLSCRFCDCLNCFRSHMQPSHSKSTPAHRRTFSVVAVAAAV